MVICALGKLEFAVPADVETLDQFRAWAASAEFPERGRISFLNGKVFVDMSPERIETHNQVKAEVDGVIGTLVKKLDLGKFYPDGLWLTNDDDDLSTEADATFVSWESLEAGLVTIVPTGDDDPDGKEMRGSPDWIMEVVSASSLRKDTKLLPVAYHRAKVREYWLVDARGDDLQFTIFHFAEDGYAQAELVNGWQTSIVFGRQFLLERERDRLGGWSYTLHMRDVPTHRDWDVDAALAVDSSALQTLKTLFS